MNLAELREKYEIVEDKTADWTQISHLDLYKYLDENRDALSALAEKDALRQNYWAKEVVRRTKQDLEWMSGYFTHETNPETSGSPIEDNLIRRENHGPILDFFVKKDDTKTIAEQSEIKDRLLLYLRGAMKSTIARVDAAQWVLNFPHIRILILTATKPLSVGTLDEIKGHFLIKERTPTLMNLFFPEYCMLEKDLDSQFEFNCPVWLKRQLRRPEPTIMASSIESTLSGFHFELILGDDMVTNINSENEDQCLKVGKNFRINRKMLRKWGYVNKVGTRYNDGDVYGLQIANNIGGAVTKSGPGWELTENSTNKSAILIGRALTIKPEVREALIKKGIPPVLHYEEAGPEGCILVMPNVWDYDSLLVEYNKDREGKWEEGSFEGQMNQNALPDQELVFDMPLLLRCTVPYTDMPYRGPISHTWDFAFSTKKGRDFTVGSSVIWDSKGTAFVNDLIREKFNTPVARAKAIVEFARKHHPFVIGIEDAGGSNLIGPTIEAEARKTGDPHVIQVCTHIDWIKPDTQNDAKRIRMSALQPLMEYGMFKFANYIPYRQVAYEEFMRCTGSKTTKNDIPDTLSYQPRYQPRLQMKVLEQGVPSWIGWNREQAAWNIIFEENCDPWGRVGAGGVYSQEFRPPEEPKFSEDIQSQSYAPGLDPILGGGLIG